MPPTSRRRKKYDQQVRSLQNRNLFAGLFLVAAAIAAVVLIIYLSLDPRPDVYVSINRIDHQGTHAIPFSLDSCRQIEDAFDRLLEYQPTMTNQDDLKKYDLDSKKSKLDLNFPSNPGDDDILIVYLNGDLSHQTSADGTCPISWYGADESHPQLPFSDLLKQVAASTAKTKVVLLDAGRHSSSAIFPGRPQNRFQSQLAEALKQQRLGDLDLSGQSDLWIITSHSDHEISRVSTPLRSSLFAHAIVDTIESLVSDTDTHDTLTVRRLFAEIHRRTTSWSRNFKGQSIQHPVLMRVGTGVVSDAERSTGTGTQNDSIAPNLLLSWKKSNAGESETKDDAGILFQWDQFASEKDADELAALLFGSDAFSAAPYEIFSSVEIFLERGELRQLVRGESLDSYERALGNTTRPIQGRQFSRNTLAAKQDAVSGLRQSVIGLAILNRFRNELRFWSDQKFDQVADVRLRPPTSLSLADGVLTKSLTGPRQLLPLQQFRDQFQSYLEAHRELVENVRQAKARANNDDPLTPMQAELLGRATQRYLPLLQQAIDQQPIDDGAADADENRSSDLVDGRPRKLKLSMAANDRVGNYKLESTDGSVAASLKWREESNRIRPFEAVGNLTDTDFRFQLAAWGTDPLSTWSGKVPNIDWPNIKPEIVFDSDRSQYFINPFELNPIDVPVEVHAVEDVEFRIVPDNEADYGRLDFGFDRKFEKLLKFRNEQRLSVFFRHPAPSSEFGKSFYFRIEGYSRKDRDKTWTFPFEIILTADPGLELIVDRNLAKVTGDHRTQSPLIRWDSQPGNKLTPLTIRTLANIKSEFRFSIINRLGSTQAVQAKLYHVLKTPSEIDAARLNADRFDERSLTDFIRWLEKSSARQLGNSKSFQLLAISPELEIPPDDGSQPQKLPLTQAPRPPGEEGPPIVVTEEVRSGLLMVVYKQDQPEVPEWYQWVRFEPRDSANSIDQSMEAAVKPENDIRKVFGQAITAETLAAVGRWHESEEGLIEQAATVRTVTQHNSGNRNDTLDLEGVFRGELLTPLSPTPALFVVDVLGVPGYRLLRTSGPRVVDAENWKNKLTGIRMALPDGKPWVTHPNNWSLVSADSMPGQFGWLDGKDRKVYVKFPEEVDREDVIDLELFLPMQNSHPLDSARIDFQLDWRGAIQTLRYPTQRRHFIELPAEGITCWSEIRAHRKRLDRDDLRTLEGQVLKISRVDPQDNGSPTELGSWTFVTKSERRRPKVVLSSTKVATNDPESLKFTLDTSRIAPSVPPESIELSLAGEPVENVGDFLRSVAVDQKLNRFQFNLKQIAEVMGLAIEPGNLRMKVTTTDFFGEKRSDFKTFTVAKPPPPSKKDKQPPPPKPIDIELVFEDAEKQPIDVNEFESLTINGTPVAWGDNVLINGRSVWAARKYDERGNPRDLIKVYGLVPGPYTFNVEARVSGKGDLSASAEADFKASPVRIVTVTFN